MGMCFSDAAWSNWIQVSMFPCDECIILPWAGLEVGSEERTGHWRSDRRQTAQSTRLPGWMEVEL